MPSDPATPQPAAPAVSIVVPTYREAENLPELFERIAAAVKPAGLAYEVVVVDDNSRDGTEEEARKAVAAGHPVNLIVRTQERGLSSAVVAGFRAARGDILLCMDADLSHPPERIPDLVRELREDRADFVIGSRYVPGAGTDENWGLFRWLNSRIATLLARPFTRARDPMAGFFALRRRSFEEAAALNPVGYKIGLELLVKCGCRRVAEVPIHFADRKRGTSKLSLREQLNYIKHLKRLADFKFGWFSRFVQFCGVGTTGMVVDLSAYTLLLHVAMWDTVARALAIWLAMTWNFGLNRRFTFSIRHWDGVVKQYFAFAATCALGAGLNWGISILLPRSMDFFQEFRLLAAVVGILAGTVSNFAISFLHVFKHRG